MKKIKMAFPHPIVLFTILIFIASTLTYIIPAGKFEFIEGTKIIDPSSFKYITQTPVSFFSAMTSLQRNISTSGFVMSLLVILGGATEVLIASGAINSLVNSGVKKYQDKSIVVVIPMIYGLMSILGALAGNDSMMAYVAIGIAVSKILKLDRLCAVGMFYLPYITSQAVGPTTSIILMINSILGLAPLPPIWPRAILFVLYYVIGATYVTRYALKVNKNPEKSILGIEGYLGNSSEENLEMNSPDYGKFELKALLSIVSVIISYVVYGIGANTLGWSWPHLVTCITISALVIGFLYRMTPNQFSKHLVKGASSMGGLILVIGFAKIVVDTLTRGNIIHTIVHSAIGVVEGFGNTTTAVVIFILNLLINLIISSGFTKAEILLPILTPIADTVEISRTTLALMLQLGDGLTNCITPVSVPMVGAITLAGVTYPKWLKFVLKVVIANAVLAGIMIVIVHKLS